MFVKCLYKLSIMLLRAFVIDVFEDVHLSVVIDIIYVCIYLIIEKEGNY